MTAHETPGRRPSPARLYRNRERGVVKGVCAGIADYFGIETWIIRCMALAGLFFFTVPTLLVYVTLALVVSPAPDDMYGSPAEKDFWRGVRVEPRGTVSGLRHQFRDMEHRLRSLETYATSREFRLSREINDLER
ncbi:MAG: envelope stress response membrane protein PspC [Rhodospirillales bacterium]|jgi:phage shock protein C|nr:envelope stress response membrane protein PspC [Rhodospirillales bacterium]MDP6805225.1 envelope stress response membrane protein PspC [Rhodospirillales bacterium]